MEGWEACHPALCAEHEALHKARALLSPQQSMRRQVTKHQSPRGKTPDTPDLRVLPSSSEQQSLETFPTSLSQPCREGAGKQKAERSPSPANTQHSQDELVYHSAKYSTLAQHLYIRGGARTGENLLSPWRTQQWKCSLKNITPDPTPLRCTEDHEAHSLHLP